MGKGLKTCVDPSGCFRKTVLLIEEGKQRGGGVLCKCVVEGKREIQGGNQGYCRNNREGTSPHTNRVLKKTLHFPLTEGALWEKEFCPENELVQGKADHIHEVTVRRKRKSMRYSCRRLPHQTQPQSRSKQQSNTRNRST